MLDLIVAPRNLEPIDWASVRRAWLELLSPSLINNLGNGPELRLLGSDDLVDPLAPLLPRISCYIEADHDNTIGLSISANGDDIDERSFVEDYGSNLKQDEIEAVIRGWSTSGYAFWLTSGGGRPGWELAAVAKLAAVLAGLTEGWVISMNSRYFDVGVGVFSPADFSTAQSR